MLGECNFKLKKEHYGIKVKLCRYFMSHIDML